MASDTREIAFEDDNPEWTQADVAHARPIADFPGLAAAFPNGSKTLGRPKGP
jgi:hypothetical protein